MGNLVSRREFLKFTGGVAAGAAAVPTTAVAAAPAAGAGDAVLPYKAKVVGKAGALGVNQAAAFTFPDASSPCALLKMGTPVAGGVGPNQDIVAYSTMCTHMGCPVSYDSAQRVFRCPCHFSIFDAERAGEMVCGQATENLPRIVLKYNDKDDSVTAVAVVGLLYGRQSNIL
jgi:arsenite oxidase small subunit